MKHVKKLNSHMGMMERRLTYLESKIDEADAPNSFDISEVNAVKVALQCMRFTQVLQSADPVNILAELLQAVRHGDDDDVVVAMAKGETAIKLMNTIKEEA